MFEKELITPMYTHTHNTFLVVVLGFLIIYEII